MLTILSRMYPTVLKAISAGQKKFFSTLLGPKDTAQVAGSTAFWAYCHLPPLLSVTCYHTSHSSSRTAVWIIYSWYNSLKQLNLTTWWLRVPIIFRRMICCHLWIQHPSHRHSAIFCAAGGVDSLPQSFLVSHRPFTI